LKVGIIGASGYTGLELIKLLVAHPKFELVYLATTQGKSSASSLHPSLEGIVELEVEAADVEIASKECELLFLALPHKHAMAYAKKLLSGGVKVVDLSADYRLDLDTYESHYTTHTDKENLSNAVYGLIEYFKEPLGTTSLAAGPGCYPTASLLGVLPFVPYLDENYPLFIDAKSGVSGAGKKLSDSTHFVNINENIFAYNPLKHRHAPEISEIIHKVTGKSFEVNFVPHLINATRGELVSIYGLLKEDIDPLALLNTHYKEEEFIRVRNNPVSIKEVAGTHYCDIFAAKNGKSLFISSAIDNLLRGASSQALAAANLMCGYDAALGMPKIAYVP